MAEAMAERSFVAAGRCLGGAWGGLAAWLAYAETCTWAKDEMKRAGQDKDKRK